MARRQTKLAAPYLRNVRVADPDATFPEGYPFTLPWLTPDFEMAFNQPVTILMGENGSGKSTLLEALAVLAGFHTSGGGAWSGGALSDQSGDPSALAARFRAGWLPKVQRGWFLKAQSFAAVSDVTAKDYLAFSHGEGFAEVVTDRMQGDGVYFLDEPEAALSPRRQAELLKFLASIQNDGSAQVIMATHSPILMAVPDASLLRITRHGIEETKLRDTDHFRLWSAFGHDPEGFVAAALSGDLENLI
ncbi:MAG: AAA family ATPase [Silicimonas sp.]|nr:AAA family ATPase [Silicimonas sp.]